jgi:hypothetical protein
MPAYWKVRTIAPRLFGIGIRAMRSKSASVERPTFALRGLRVVASERDTSSGTLPRGHLSVENRFQAGTNRASRLPEGLRQKKELQESRPRRW